jgi:hypothetical protein
VTASLKSAYIEKIDERGDLQVWIVDGSYVRGHVDEEFTNFGQHYRYPYIPVNELWIDREAEHDERQFFIEHLLVEHKLMAKGMPYEKALPEADREERRERNLSGDVNRMTHNGQKLPDGKDVHERLWRKLDNGVSIWIVNGRLVTMFMNLFLRTRSGLMMPLLSQNEPMCYSMNFTSEIAWLKACPTIRLITSQAT